MSRLVPFLFFQLQFPGNHLKYISHMVSYDHLELSLFLHHGNHSRQCLDLLFGICRRVLQHQPQSGGTSGCAGNIFFSTHQTDHIQCKFSVISYCFCHFSSPFPLLFSMRSGLLQSLPGFPDNRFSRRWHLQPSLSYRKDLPHDPEGFCHCAPLQL